MDLLTGSSTCAGLGQGEGEEARIAKKDSDLQKANRSRNFGCAGFALRVVPLAVGQKKALRSGWRRICIVAVGVWQGYLNAGDDVVTGAVSERLEERARILELEPAVDQGAQLDRIVG